jgi:hypothetical protein
MPELEDLVKQGVLDVELNVANPKTSGYAGVSDGAIGRGTDGTRWMKVGSGDTDWEQIVTTNGLYSPVAAGTPTVAYGSTAGEIDQIYDDIPDSWGGGSVGTLKGLVIGTSCESIGSSAFSYESGLINSLTIPDLVTSIGSYAFYYCSGFTGSLTIGNSVASIGGSAFNSCSGFTGSLVIPNSVTSIGGSAFRSCSGFTGDLTIPNSVTSIGSYAFYSCTGFTSVYIDSVNASAWDGSNALNNTASLNNIYVNGTQEVLDSYDAAWKTAQGTTATVSEWTSYPDPMP